MSHRRAFRRGSRSEDDVREEVEEELQYHLERCMDELVSRGWTRAEARAEALRQFGDIEETRTYCARQSMRAKSEERRTMWWDDLRQDLAYALRGLKRSPTYAFVVVTTLAAGIAASTLVFSLMNPYFFRALPFPAADQLVQVGGVDPLEGWDGGRFSAPQIVDLASRSRSVSELGGYYYGTTNLGTNEGEVRRENVGRLSGNLMGLLGSQPLLGRTLQPADGRAGAEPVVVVGEDLWDRVWGADPDLVGRRIQLDGVAHAVVGIMPREFVFPFGGLYLWTAVDLDPVATSRAGMGVLPVGRLADGWTPDEAARELSGIQASLAVEYPEEDGRYSGVSVKPLREALNFVWDILRIAFGLILGAVVMLLVIACVNVASLTLARATTRAREVSVRAALGAGRRRLVRQLLAEGALLALLGGILGTAIVYIVGPMLSSALPPDLYRVGDATVDGRVLAFSALVTLATPLVFGLAPALTLTRRPLASVLRTGRTGADRSTLRGRRFLVALEVALAIVLVTGTGLMARSLQEVTGVDLGFEADRILSVSMAPGQDAYPTAAELATFWDRVRDRVAAEPGVEALGTVSHLPLNHETFPLRYQTPSAAGSPVEEWPSALTSRADPDYFAAMGIPLLAGRTFAAVDVEDGDPVIISQGMADRIFPQGDAVGRTVLYGSGDEPRSGTVVGVVGDVRYEDLTSPVRPHLYRPLDGTATRRRFILLRTSGSPAELAGAARRAVREVDASVAPTLRPLREIVRESTLLWTVSSVFLGAFGVIALLLATLGIYGVIAFSVAQRRSEIGLRMALGADGRALQRSVVADGLRLTGIGLAVGLVLSVGLAGLARNVLYGVSILDPVTVGAVLALFSGVTLVASAIPARRAARVDPLRVLRDD